MEHGNSQPLPRPPVLRETFKETTPPAFERVAGHPNTLKALSLIERRAADVRERTVVHLKAFHDLWTAKEAIKIWERHLKERDQMLTPPGVGWRVSPEEMLKIASHNVRARGLKRLSRIQAIKSRMSNAVVRALDTPWLKKDFERAAPDRTNDPQPIQTMRRKQ